MRGALALVLGLLLAGCGHKGALTRVPADADWTVEQRREQRARDAADTEAGLRLQPEARPVRQDDVLTVTRERRTDGFDLPPP